MSYLIASANGNLTTAATWGVCDSTASPTEAANAALTTAYVEGTAFTPGAITIDGIAVKLASRTASPASNTMSVHLAQGGVEVTGTAVTVNVSDLPTCSAVAGSATHEGGWFFLKFAAPVTLAGATLYTVGAKTSAVSMVNLFSTAATDWARLLRTTTTAAPVAADNMVIAGEWSSPQGTPVVTRTVTMDSTVNTAYGSIEISKGGTLNFGIAASTNYYLRHSGITVYNGGTYSQGTVANPIPATSTAVDEANCVGLGDFGITVKNGGTINKVGVARTAGKNVTKTFLSANYTTGTSASVTIDTGWKSGDLIAVAATNCPAGGSLAFQQTDSVTLGADAGASTLTLSGALTHTHVGDPTSPPRAEVILLTRNVVFRSASATGLTYCYLAPGAVWNFSWTEFRYIGATAAGKRGIEADTTPSSGGSGSMTFCSIHDSDLCVSLGLGSATWGGIAISDLRMYNVAINQNNYPLRLDQNTTGGGATLDDFDILLSQNGGIVFLPYCTVTNGTFVNTFYPGSVSMNNPTSLVGLASAVGPFTFHSCNYLNFGSAVAGWRHPKINITTWYNASGTFYPLGYGSVYELSNVLAFGNQGTTAFGTSQTGSNKILIDGGIITGSVAVASVGSPLVIDSAMTEFVIDNVEFSKTGGIYAALLGPPINPFFPCLLRAVLRNCKLNGSQPFPFLGTTTQDNLLEDSYLSYEKFDQIAGAHCTFMGGGTINTDTAIFRTASPSLRMWPRSTSVKLASAPATGLAGKGFMVPVLNGVAKPVTVYVRTSLLADSAGASPFTGTAAAYNGNAPRLIQRANPSLGQNSDVVLATFSGSAGAWVAVSGVTSVPTDDGAFEIVVDCDGTAGWINVDFPNGQKYWFDGLPSLSAVQSSASFLSN